MTPWSPGDLAPGLVALAAAGALTWILARFYDRVPPAVAAAFLAATALLFGRVLAGGAVLLPLDSLRARAPFLGLPAAEPPANPLQGDLLQLVVPARAEVRRAFAAGRWPLWSPRMGAGMPLLADPQAQALQPLTGPGLLLPPVGRGRAAAGPGLESQPGPGPSLPVARAAAVDAALRVYASLLFTYLFLGRLGLGVPAALAGSLSWGLGGFVLLWLGWPLANSAALLPALSYALCRTCDRGGRRDAALLAGSLWALALAGHPETALYAAALGAAFLAARASRPRPAGAPPRRRVLAFAAGSLAVALAAAAPALLPAATYLPRTLRAVNLAREPTPPPAAAEAARRLALRLVPVAAPNAFGNDRYHAYWGADNVNEDASGFVGTAAVLLAISGLFRRRERRPQEGVFLAGAALCLAVVSQAPGVVPLLARLPGGSVSGYHHRLLLLLGFCLAVLAACELDRRGKLWPPLLAAGGLAAFHAWAYLAFRYPEDPGRLDVLRWGSLLWHLRSLAAVLVLLFLARRWPRAALGVPAVAAAELLALLGPANPPAPRHLAFPKTPPLAFLLAGGPSAERVCGVEFALLPNVAALYGLADARVYNPAAPADYVGVTRAITVGWSGEVPDFGRPEHPLYDLLGVRHVLAPPEAVLPDPLRRVFAGPAGAVWERPRALPRLFLPAAATSLAADWPRQVEEVADFAARSLAAAVPGGAWAAGRPDEGAVHLLGERPAHLFAAFAAPEPRLLASSIFQDGGWRLLVDGRRHPAIRTNGPFLGAWLPAGKHRLDLVYRPRPFIAGCLAAGLAAAAALAWWLPPPRRREPPRRGELSVREEPAPSGER